MRDIDLKIMMQELYDNMEYFAKVDSEGMMDFENDYHEVSKDPDGKVRELLNERDHNLSGIKEVTDHLDNTQPGRILDIGCGPGWLLSYLSEKWDKNGIEISKFASNHAAQYGKIHNGTLGDYNFDGNKFDVINMYHVIEHLLDPIYALKKIKNMLAPSGVFILGTPDFDSGAARRWGRQFRMLNDPTHISLFSSDSMHRCLRDLGFKIIKVEYPYFDTPWFTKDELMRVFDENSISPPFYGSIMTFFSKINNLE